MTPRRRRLVAVLGVIIGVGIASTLALQAFQENMLYFYSPSDVLAGEAVAGRKIRLGGLVLENSVRREEGSLEMRFDVTDNVDTLTVSYTGVLPDLFREGQGVIAHGYLDGSGVFIADEVLAKHDENYMPPEVAEMLAEKGHPVDSAAESSAQ